MFLVFFFCYVFSREINQFFSGLCYGMVQVEYGFAIVILMKRKAGNHSGYEG